MIYDDLFAAAETTHNLPAGILRAMAVQESGLNPWAGRFERAFQEHYINSRMRSDLPGLWPRGVSEETERVWRSTSWGLLQVMGQVARELGFVGPFLSQLTDPETGIEFGARQLAAKLKKYPVLADALSAYNSGVPTAANRDSYVAPILARLATP